MPKEITHVIFSDKTLKNLDKNNKLFNSISSNLDFYHLGAIAVDSFYYNIKIPFIDKDFHQWGDLVHGADGNDTALAFRNCATYLKENKNEPNFDKKISFICGFLTHMAMDINFHPYVYYFSGNYYDGEYSKKVDAMMRHRLIESWIDLYILDKNNIDLNEFDSIDKIEKNQAENYQMFRFLCGFFAKAWNTDKDLFPSFKRGYHIQMFLNNVLVKNKSIFSFFRTLNDVFDNKLRDYLALFYPEKFQEMPDFIVNFDKYKHPVTGEIFHGTVDGLFNNAIELSTSFLTAINDYVFEDLEKTAFDHILKGYSLDVGLEGVNVEKVKYFSPWSIVP